TVLLFGSLAPTQVGDGSIFSFACRLLFAAQARSLRRNMVTPLTLTVEIVQLMINHHHHHHHRKSMKHRQTFPSCYVHTPASMLKNKINNSIRRRTKGGGTMQGRHQK
ncbi:MAG: hypothetical protein ABJZ69_17580, partial [Hyphomicrobiales bacterium]